MKLTLLMSSVLMLTAAIRVDAGAGPKAVADRPAAAESIQRGASVAARVCAACHATGRSGVSPRPEAPTFVDINKRYARTRLDWELETIVEVGHYRMPPIPMTKEEIGELDAYVRSLRSVS